MAKLTILIAGDAAGATKALKDVEKGLGGLSGAAGKIGGVMGDVAGALGGVAKIAGGFIVAEGLMKLPDILGDMAGKAIKSQEVQAQLNNVLKSTGGIAGVTAAELNKHAQALQQVTRFDDEAINSGQSLLLTFTNIGKDVFPAATETMLNMSQALGQDLKSSAIQLGKALNDPKAGITALSRVGVSFTKAQKDMIAEMLKVGDVAGAQRVILKELETEFGGAAKAAGQTLGGQLEILGHRFDDIVESIGTAFLPIVTKVVTAVSQWLPGAFAAVEPVIQGFVRGIERMGAVWTLLTGNLTETTGAFAFLQEAFGPQVATGILHITQLVRGMFDLFSGGENNFDTLNGALRSLFGPEAAMQVTTFIANVITSWNQLVALFQAAPGQLEAVRAGINFDQIAQATTTEFQVMQIAFNNFMADVQRVAAFIAPVMAVIVTELGRFWTEIEPKIGTAWAAISSTVLRVVDQVGGVIVAGMQALAKFWEEHWEEISAILTAALDVIFKAVEVWWSLISGAFSVALSLLSGDWSAAWETIKQTFVTFHTAMDGLQKALWALIKSVWDLGMADIKERWGALWVAVTTKVEEAANTIKAKVVEIINGVIGTVNRGISAVRSALGSVAAGANNLIGGVQNTINAAVRAANVLAGKVGVQIHEIDLSGYSVSAPGIDDIPRLAAGGIVRRPTLAMIGESGPEAVVPLNRGGGGVGGITINLTVNGSVWTTKQLTDEIHELLVDKGFLNSRDLVLGPAAA